jgi:ATP diphosphatase
VRDLRKRCPWDAKQTPQTLRPYLVEEVMELDHAIRDGNSEEIRAELGDMLLHLAFQIVLGEESGDFGAEDVTRAIEAKMHRRHPHLFHGEEVPESWERQKKKEMADGASVLDGLPRNMPPTLMAHRLQEKAAGVGFDWPDTRGPLDKLREEIGELDEVVDSDNRERIEDELGDVMFSLINLARKLEFDPRAVLEKANEKFSQRFRAMEKLAIEEGLEVGSSDLETLDGLWNQVKAKRRGEHKPQRDEE